MPKIPDIESFKKRWQEIEDRMGQSDFYSDQRVAAELSREHRALGNLISAHTELCKVDKALSEARAMLNDPSTDSEMVELAKEEIRTLEEQFERLQSEVLVAMLPPDPSDSRNTVVEIRAGAGGDEASLFAADLCRMYQRFAENRGWKIEPLGSSPSEAGGFKEVCFLISGEDVYRTLKFESGVHRVQRIPVTESGGRIHTSTATVAVLPEAEEVDIVIRPDDLEITVTRASGPGGQGVNTTDSAVQIHHKPSGMIVTCADERSQLKNKLKALTVLRSRLLRQREEAERAKYAANRRSQIGTGDRSERIRTYNFPQNRLTDHRIGATFHDLPSIMDGNIDAILEALSEADLRQRLESSGSCAS